MNSIPASQLVNVIPSVLSAGGNPLSLNAVFLTTDISIPIGTVKAFASAPDVADWFGATAIESILAGIYFSGYENAQTLPGTLYFAQYNEAAVAAYLRTGSFAGVTLSQLQALSGELIVTIDGRIVTSANIDLLTAASFTNAAALIQAGLQTPAGIFSGQATIDDGAGGPGNTLTVTVVNSGAVHVGDTVVGAGIAPGTTITALGTGTGGVGTYTLSGAAQHIAVAEAVTVATAATVSYDAQLAEFVIESATTGATSTIGFATGTLSAGLKATAATGAVTSQGAAAAVQAAAMNQVASVTQNWATFMTMFEPDTAGKLAFAAWVQGTKKRFAYVAWDSDVTPLAGDAPESFGAQCLAAEFDGIFPIYEPADDNGSGRKAAFVCGTAGSIDFDQTNGRIDFCYKGQAGLAADIGDETTGNNLMANGYNFYGNYATANDHFVNLQRGSTPGQYRFFDSYINQIWFNSALELATMVLLTSVRSIPYNTPGYNLVRSAWLDPIQQALNNGVCRPGITLSNAQKAEVNTAAGANIADTLQTAGYYIQIKDADPVTRGNRGSPPSTIWYTDGESIQRITLNSINVL
jgi:Protein of unknown function (DUF3383)